jgi:hypothetical protein
MRAVGRNSKGNYRPDRFFDVGLCREREGSSAGKGGELPGVGGEIHA